MKYLDKPLTVNQADYIMKFFNVLFDLHVISGPTWSESAVLMDEAYDAQARYSWENPPPQCLPK